MYSVAACADILLCACLGHAHRHWTCVWFLHGHFVTLFCILFCCGAEHHNMISLCWADAVRDPPFGDTCHLLRCCCIAVFLLFCCFFGRRTFWAAILYSVIGCIVCWFCYAGWLRSPSSLF